MIELISNLFLSRIVFANQILIICEREQLFRITQQTKPTNQTNWYMVRLSLVSGDAPRIFMDIIRKRLWSNITQADEDRALAALKRYRTDDQERFRYREKGKLKAA